MTNPVKVLYIAGAGRSGTTLLDCMLGQVDGVFSAGEVTHIWDRGLLGDELCGCGRPFSHCPFWRRVVELALGSSTRPSPHDLEALRASVCGLTRLPSMMYPFLRSRDFRSRMTRYATLLAGVYASIRDASHSEVVVDSSKYPPEAYLLREMPGVEPYLVHMVRNANAVAYAWQKRTWRPEVHDRLEPMPRYPALQTALAWNVFNWATERLGRLGVPYLRLRYEDLVGRPRRSVARVFRLLGRNRPELSFVRKGQVELGTNHTVSGNPMRLEYGRLPLIPDQEWEREASAFQKLLVNGLTFVQQLRYGYLALPFRGARS